MGLRLGLSVVIILLFGLRIQRCFGSRAALMSFVWPEDVEDSNIVDVTSMGAKGDGLTDDTKAFQAAWQAVCAKESSTLLIPADYRFLVGPITFSGPYQSNM